MINVTIKGNNAMLIHKYNVSSVSDPKTRVIKVKDSSNYADEWKKATYLDKDGFVVMPSINLMACLFDGSKGMKKGKKALTRIVYTSFLVMPFEPLLLHPDIDHGKNELGGKITLQEISERDWLHAAGAVISGRRVDRVRTMIPEGWIIEFQIKQKDDSLSANDIRAIVESAGSSAGLGDWRPSSPKKPGAYGTFEILSFDEVK